jgi:integrase
MSLTDLVPVNAKQRRGSLHGQHVPGHPNLQYQGLHNFIRVRVKVPRELRPMFGKSELTRGLGTNKINEAIRLSRPIIVEFERTIEAARQHIAPADPTVFMRVRHEPVSLGAGDLSRGEASQIAAFIHQRFGKRVSVSGGFGETGGFRLANASEYYSDVPLAKVAEVEAELAGMPQTAEGKMPLAGYSYQAALDQWALDTGARTHSKAVYAGHLAYFFEQQGIASGLMGDVTADHIVAHKIALQQATKKDGSPQFGPKTINNRLGSIRAVFRNAKSNRKITTDPTLEDGMPVIHKLKVEKTDRDFSREQFAKIVAKALESDDPIIKWHWLIAATLGARIGELADAKVSAIQEIEGYPIIAIDPKFRGLGPDGKPLLLKTTGSKRKNPLHSIVLNAGFLSYVETIRAEHGPDAPLFPMLRPNRDGYRSDEASLICNKWLRKVIGIDDLKLTFHSMRHSVKTFLRGRVGDEAAKALTGHSDGSVSSGYGRTEMAVMSDAIETHIKIAA